jgi:hypothetical protein
MPEGQEILESVKLGMISDPAPQGKRIVFTNENPNSQGSIVRNSTIDFSRFNINPVILANHDWETLPLGHMTNIRLEANGDYTGIPVFHEIDEPSQIYKKYYEGGWIRTASIGGQAVWSKKLGTGKFAKDKEGNTIGEYNKEGYLESEYFDLFEISLPTLPANPTAATDEALRDAGIKLSTKFYDTEIENITGQLVTLSSELVKLNSKTMAKEKKEDVVVEETVKQAEKSEEVTETQTEDPNRIRHIKLGAEKSLPEMVKDYVLSLVKSAFAHPEGEYGDTPIVKTPEKEIVVNASESSEKKEEEMKAEPVKEEAEMKAEDAEMCNKSAVEMSAASDEKADSTKVELKAEPEKVIHIEKTILSMIPEKKTSEELKDDKDVKLAATPEMKVQFKEGKTFTKLSQDKGEGANILNRVFNGSNDGKELNDYKTVLNSIMEDPKYAAFAAQSRFHMNTNEAEMLTTRNSLNTVNRQNSNVGLSFKEIATRLDAGYVTGIDYKLGAKDARRTTLSTDGNFATMDTVAIEWLSTILFKLFPAESWKYEIPVFAASETGRNIGVIWTNIAADPEIYVGTNPSPASDYTYTDTAVGLKLIPYWMQPIRWTPQYMHQLRYDQQGSGWSQALRKLEAVQGDKQLYTLGAGALANNLLLYTGGPIDSTQAQNFTVGTGSNGVDKFYFNTAFQGSLLKPGFNDIMKIEQFFAYQNFDLSSEKVVAIVDTITNSYLKQDKATQSYLTRWINDGGADIQKIAHTQIHERSRIIAYEPTGGTVIDTQPAGTVIPATTQSANLAIIPSQVGIALGLIDVFFVQDPANYGFKMSMDMRLGIRALRSDYAGTAIYGYSSGVQAGQ